MPADRQAPVVGGGPPLALLLEAAHRSATAGIGRWVDLMGNRLGDGLASLRRRVDEIRDRVPLLRILDGAGMGGRMAVRGLNTASMSFCQGSRRGPQPVFDLAMDPDELKARISTIPIYTVANNKNEFVLVSAEGQRQVGLLFLSEEGAYGLVDKMKKVNPSMGRNSKVLRVMLDDVYDLLTTPKKELQGAVFRFVPDMKQVANALEVYQSAGVPTRAITGVPVFQAEGLSITTDSSRSTPIFLSKDDLDVAVETAQKMRVQRLENQLQAVAEQFDAEAAEALSKAENGDKNDAKKWKAAAAKAEGKAAEARKKMADKSVLGTRPRVEVGSLEDVISRMECDTTGTWGNVTFVRSGIIADPDGGIGTAKKS
ncbi:unnamed protein product [Ostreobium quekettii]|uniref:Uncharacterized protein n=1 Tax=Ostreobium quekettii TaxID=121088 RepID=A0A8S1J9J0_9CHLO|nr:unnamed protein product [Ostreobium quekettii]|eukprot:evm.model.scf_881EXC.1 EVM.evm.TU.scf_881EXC.1   scf_881EXC:3748-11625(+)